MIVAPLDLSEVFFQKFFGCVLVFGIVFSSHHSFVPRFLQEFLGNHAAETAPLPTFL